MGLKSYEGIVEMAERASRVDGNYSKPFYRELHEALRQENQKTRSGGDKQAFPYAIKRAMDAATTALRENHPRIERCKYPVPMTGFARPKTPDYAFTNGARFYVIEQKSMLAFNEFAPGLLQGLLAKKFGGVDVRYALLFNYLKQPIQGFQNLCSLGDEIVVDHLCVLIPNPAYDAYSNDAVEGLFSDIASWLE